jgi:multiple sugar transport system substrate-binding protein
LQLAAGTTVATLLAAACAPVPAAAPQQGEAAAPAAEQKEEAAADAAAPAQAPVDVRFTTVGWGGWLAEPWMAMVQKFNESQSQANVAYEDIAEGYEKVLAQAAGDIGADVYTFENKQMFSFASRGFFLPLDDMVASSQVIKKEAYFEEDWAEGFFKGKQYLAPFDNSPAMIWYNKDIFDEAGVPYPPAKFDDPDWKWADFLETAKKLTTGEGAEKVFGWAGERWWVYLLNWIWSNGGWVLNEEKTECVIDMPETVEALEWAAALVLEHKVQPAVDQIIQGGNSAMFFGRRAAMAQKGTWWAIDLKAQEGLNWNVAPQPMGKAGTFVRNPLDGFGIWQGSAYPEQSWEMIEFFSQPEIMGLIVKAGLSVSHKDTMTTVFLEQEPKDVHWDLFLQALDGHTRPHPDTAIFPEMDNLLKTAWEAVIDGASTVPEMVAQVKGPINDLLADCIQKGNCAA